MNTDKHFSLLASAHDNQQQLGGLTATEDIGSQIQARNLLSGDVLDRGPPLGIQEHFVTQPIGDRRLLDSRSIEENGNTAGQLNLATRNLYSTTKGSNVVWLHARQYKAANDYVKKAPYMISYEAPYILDVMAKRKASAEARLRRAKELTVWPDGRTANQRFEEAFTEWRQQVPSGAKLKTETDLSRACNVIAGFPADQDPPYLSQPMINQLLSGEVDASRSQFLDVAAEVMGFRSIWIRTGAGERRATELERQLRSTLQTLLREAGIVK